MSDALKISRRVDGTFGLIKWLGSLPRARGICVSRICYLLSCHKKVRASERPCCTPLSVGVQCLRNTYLCRDIAHLDLDKCYTLKR